MMGRKNDERTRQIQYSPTFSKRSYNNIGNKKYMQYNNYSKNLNSKNFILKRKSFCRHLYYAYFTRYNYVNGYLRQGGVGWGVGMIPLREKNNNYFFTLKVEIF